MGSLCSNLEKDDAPGEKDGQPQRRNSKTLTRQSSKRLQENISHHLHRQRNQSTSPEDDFLTLHQTDMDMKMAQKMITAQDEVIDKTRDRHGLKKVADKTRDGKPKPRSADVPDRFVNVDDFLDHRDEMQRREGTISFDFSRTVLASEKEKRANEILQALKADDNKLYAGADKRIGWGGQQHPRYAGDHFLSNVDLIEKTKLYRVATKMPKGAHLHIHFNACLKPNVLLDIAKTMDHMFITSDKSLAPAGAGITEEAAKTALDSCEIQFQILPFSPQTDEKKGNLFEPAYKAREVMQYTQFLAQFRQIYPDREDPEQWLASKLVFNEKEAHNHLQTVQGAWEKFNGRTRMMKGLFNYENAYRAYTQGLLEDLVRDNIQYAEIRPNFMFNNQVWKNDGSKQIENYGIMELIIEEYNAFQKRTNDYFGGMKVIYCAPRSFSPAQVQFGLNQCLEFKKKWPEWIAGFDLVGEESQGEPLKTFVAEFLQFRKDCDAAGLDIPFLFHCGETNEIGGETDGNLLDALLLNSRRIGHGFALARHPYIMEHMKKRGVCLEVCPISNEVLGLTPRIGGHSVYNLLANNVHCTVNSDNGTIFRSSLSHDFYQVMVGKSDMTLHGWRQLIEWSLEHSCMSRGEEEPEDNELAAVRAKWLELWEVFLDWIISEYGKDKPSANKKASA